MEIYEKTYNYTVQIDQLVKNQTRTDSANGKLGELLKHYRCSSLPKCCGGTLNPICFSSFEHLWEDNKVKIIKKKDSGYKRVKKNKIVYRLNSKNSISLFSSVSSSNFFMADKG